MLLEAIDFLKCFSQLLLKIHVVLHNIADLNWSFLGIFLLKLEQEVPAFSLSESFPLQVLLIVVYFEFAHLQSVFLLFEFVLKVLDVFFV